MENASILVTNPQPERSIAKYWLIGGAIFLFLALCYGIHGCVSTVSAARDQANSMVAALHYQMETQDWDQIYQTASDGYRAAVDRQKSQLYFSSINRKLGTPTTTAQQSAFISATTNGTFIKALYKTQFSQGDTAIETIVWKEDGDGKYRLFNYNIQSDALITK